MSNRSQINQRVVQAAEAALHHHHYVSPVDVLMGIGFLQPIHLQDWRKGKIPHLESVIQGSLGKISFAMKCFRAWAHQKGLKPSQTAYLARARGSKKELQFSKSGNPEIEQSYRTHYVSPLLSERMQAKLKDLFFKSLIYSHKVFCSVDCLRWLLLEFLVFYSPIFCVIVGQL